jgi:two-component system, NarL family, response regulator NreC
VKVLLADDHRLIREGLRALLEQAGVEVVGEAADGHEAIARAKQLSPHVVVIDVAMPGLNGIDATKRIRVEAPSVKVLALSMNSDRRYVTAMLDAGASGYLLKSAASDELLDALAVVLRGATYLSPAIADGVALRGVGGGRGTPVPGSVRVLSGREREVLQLIAEGKTSKEIAATLDIAVPTVETHRRQIMAKLDVRTIAELTKYAIREGLTSA